MNTERSNPLLPRSTNPAWPAMPSLEPETADIPASRPAPQAPNEAPHRSAGSGIGLRLASFLVLASVATGAGAGAVAGRLSADTGDGGTAPAASATASSGSIDARGIIQRTLPSVVTIDVTATNGAGRRTVTQQASGTGFVLRSDGLIATNAHVVAGANAITVSFADGSSAAATVVGSDSNADLAVLRVNRTGLAAAPLGSSGALQMGDPVVAVGNALDLGATPSASTGIVSALDRTITTNDGNTLQHLVQTDAAINPGDSGGPLLNGGGLVVGISTAGNTSAQNIGFAIPIDQALPILNGLSH